MRNLLSYLNIFRAAAKPVDFPLDEVKNILGVEISIPSRMTENRYLLGRSEDMAVASFLTVLCHPDGKTLLTCHEEGNPDYRVFLAQISGQIKDDNFTIQEVSLQKGIDKQKALFSMKKVPFNEEKTRKLLMRMSTVREGQPMLDLYTVQEFLL